MADFDPRTGASFAALEFLEGRVAFERGDFEGALRLFESSERQEPHFKTKLFIARIHAALGRETEAFSAFVEAYNLNPHHPQTSVEYAQALLSREEHKEAARILRRVLERNRTYGPARKLLGTIRQTDT